MNLINLKSRSDLTPDEFDILIDAENNVVMVKKLFYFKLKAMGFSVKEASKIANIKQFTAYKLEDKWNEGGYNELLHKKGAGRKIKLNKKQLKQLEKHLLTQDEWTIKQVQNWLKDEFQINYGYSALEHILNTHFNVKIIKQKDLKKKQEKIKTQTLDQISSDIESENNIELNNLINQLKNEKNDVNVVKKLFYLILNEINIPIQLICTILKISLSTGKNWEKQWKNGGEKALKRKTGSGPKCKLSDEQLKELHDEICTKEVWFMWEILNLVEKKYNIQYSQSQMYRILKKMGINHRVPHPKEYRQAKNYKTTFRLNLYNKLKKYHIKYNPEDGTFYDLKSKRKVKFYSFDEAAFDLIGNCIKVWSAFEKINMLIDSTKYFCKAAGFYSLTPDGKDHLIFQENAKKETIAEILKEMRIVDPEGIHIVFIDNFSSHKSDLVKDTAKELDIDLMFLPAYSPQLQPVEKVWLDIKNSIFQYKIAYIPDLKEMNKNDRLDLLMELVEEFYYVSVESKNKWNYLLNDYILPVIKQLHPRTNSHVELEIN